MELIASMIANCEFYSEFDEVNIYIRNPGRDLGGYMAFLSGFTDNVWFVTVATLLTLPICMFMAGELLDYYRLR